MPVFGAAEPLVFSHEGTQGTFEVAEATAAVARGQPVVQFALTPAAGAAMAEMTGRLIGESVTVTLCDIELLRAVLRARIAGRGVITLSSVEASMAVADVLRGDAGCEALAPHFPG